MHILTFHLYKSLGSELQSRLTKKDDNFIASSNSHQQRKRERESHLLIKIQQARLHCWRSLQKCNKTNIHFHIYIYIFNGHSVTLLRFIDKLDTFEW